MKKILITGANSYIGTSFEQYMSQWSESYQIDTLNMIDGTWREKDFSEYDTIYHVAGIAHQKETNENRQMYYDINRDLAIEVAEKAKVSGVGQFIFLSSMSVYGLEMGIINSQTETTPKTHYGISKLQAENGIREIESDSFKVVIMRPPMVYGKNCKGNFQAVIKLVKKFPFFPKLKNARSMIYIVNLCEFVKCIIDREERGLFFPQNKDLVSTDEMAKYISQALEKKISFSSLFGVLIKIVRPYVSVLRKAFGDLQYDMEEVEFDYQLVGFEDSIKRSI